MTRLILWRWATLALALILGGRIFLAEHRSFSLVKLAGEGSVHPESIPPPRPSGEGERGNGEIFVPRSRSTEQFLTYDWIAVLLHENSRFPAVEAIDGGEGVCFRFFVPTVMLEVKNGWKLSYEPRIPTDHFLVPLTFVRPVAGGTEGRVWLAPGFPYRVTLERRGDWAVIQGRALRVGMRLLTPDAWGR